MFEVSVIEDLEDETALGREWGEPVGAPAADRVCDVPWVICRLKRHLSWLKEYAQTNPAKLHMSMPMKLGCVSGWRGFDFLQGVEPCSPGSAGRRHRLNLATGMDGGSLRHVRRARWRSQIKAALGPAMNTLKRMSQRTVA